MQVAEHPVLACVRQAALKEKSQDQSLEPLTNSQGRSTPVLVRGAQRRVQIDNSIYGNKFAHASNEVIQSSVSVINPPTISKIRAIEAPKNGSGEYTHGTINTILGTAYTGFIAAKVDSYSCCNSTSKEIPIIIIHTGHWGTGAYGGNKVIMAILQIAAAHLAELDQLVYWAFSEPEAVHEAISVVNEIVGDGCTVTDFMHAVEAKKYKWGLSNGT